MNTLDKLFNFIGSLAKASISLFIGGIIAVGIVWIFKTIIEVIIVVLKTIWKFFCLLFGIKTKQHYIEKEANEVIEYYKQHGVYCEGCKTWVPKRIRCCNCGEVLNKRLIEQIKNEEKMREQGKVENQEIVPHESLNIEQYYKRKKYQKIRCPFCNAMSKVVEELYKGHQIRECHNGHIFNYDYESEMALHEDIHWKYS